MKKRFPEGWAHWAIAALAFLIVLGPLFAEATVSGLRPYDEGIALTSAFRMYAGETPRRDFDTVYGPAESGALYLLSGTTGPKLLHLRLLRYGGFALAAFFATLGAARLGGAAVSVLAAAIVLSFATPLTSPSISLALSGAVLADLGSDRRAHSRVFAFAAGLAAGLTFLFRFSFGALGCVAALAAIWFGATRSDATSPLRARISRVAVFATGLAPGVLTLVALIAAGRADLGWVLNYRGLGPYRSLPFPIPTPAGTSLLDSLETLVWAGLPFLVLFVSLAVLGVQLWKRATLRDAAPPGLQLGLTLLLIGWLPYALFRPDLPHFYPALMVSGCLGAGLLGRLLGRAPDRLRALLGFCLVLALGALSFDHFREARALRRSPDRVASALLPLRGLLVDRKLEDYYSEASELVRSLTQPGDRLYVGSLDHRRILMNDPLLYAISERLPATRHTCFAPGQTTREAKQREMIRDLETHRPPVVFLAPSWREEPNRSREFGSDLLDRYLSRSYRLYRRVGPSLLLVRRGEPDPPGDGS